MNVCVGMYIDARRGKKGGLLGVNKAKIKRQRESKAF